MNQKLAIRRLWWKEFRQLWPLVTMLVGIGAVLHLLFLPSSMSHPEFGGHMLVLLGLPGLFAVGAGAMLVGQEKELRTLNWLSSLPIAARDLIRVKLGASVVGLVVVWLCSVMLMALAMAISGPTAFNSNMILFQMQNEGSEFTWPLHSLYLLVAGLALAWKVRSTFVALLLIVPMALLPKLTEAGLSYLLSSVDGLGHLYYQPSDWILVGCQLLFIAAVVWIGWRVAITCLDPDRAALVKRSLGVSNRFGFGQSIILHRPTQPPFPALIWQAAQQNRAVLIGTTGTFFLAWIQTLRIFGNPQGDPGATILAVLLGWLATSWLGVSAFQGDRLHQRIRFLADRGVSPKLTWLTRHLVPVCVLVVAVFGLVLVAWRLVEVDLQSQANQQSNQVGRSLQNIIPIIGIACGAGLIVYAISQWVSQVLLSPIVATIIAPLVSLAAFIYSTFAFDSLGTPVWLLAVCVVIPLVATYVSMNRWMDGRFGKVFWAWHASALATCLLLPTFPFMVAIVSQTGMPRDVARELTSVARQGRLLVEDPVEIVLTSATIDVDQGEQQSYGDSIRASIARLEQGQATDDDAKPKWSLNERRQAIYTNLSKQLAMHHGSIMYPHRAVDFLKAEANLSRMYLQAPDNEPNSNHTERYRTAIGLLTTFVERTRMSPRLIDQDSTDYVEIWLLQELKRPQIKQWLGDDGFAKTAKLLADQSGRTEARRRAVASIWLFRGYAYIAHTNNQYTLGGYAFPQQKYLASTVLRNRRVDVAIADLWTYLKSSETGADSSTRESIAKFWQVSPELYGTRPTANYLHADDLDKSSIGTFNRLHAPGAQWHAGWEQQAIELAQQ